MAARRRAATAANDPVEAFKLADLERYREEHPDVRRPTHAVIVAKYAGRCAECGVPYGVGAAIKWRAGEKARHADCRRVAADAAARAGDLLQRLERAG